MEFLTQAPAPTAEHLAKIESAKAAAADRERVRAESWERSDTDGFLTQWAAGLGAELERAKIKILEHGGYAEFAVLCDAGGTVIAEKVFSFPDGHGGTNNKWRLPDDMVEAAGRRWVPFGATSRVQKALGLHEESRWFKAYAKITGTGHGLSGSAWIAVFKEGE